MDDRKPAWTSPGFSAYTDRVAAELCSRVAAGKSVTRVCREEGMPCLTTVTNWAKERPEFAEMLKAAKEMYAEFLVDEALEIVDDTDDDIIETPRGPLPNSAAIQRAALRSKMRQWIAAKYKPQQFGDKLEIEGGNAVQVVQVFAIPDNGRGEIDMGTATSLPAPVESSGED